MREVARLEILLSHARRSRQESWFKEMFGETMETATGPTGDQAATEEQGQAADSTSKAPGAGSSGAKAPKGQACAAATEPCCAELDKTCNLPYIEKDGVVHYGSWSDVPQNHMAQCVGPLD